MANTRYNVFGCVFFVLPAASMNTNMTPTFDFPVFRYGFLPRHSFGVCCTLHPDLPCDPYCRASSYFSTWTVLFRSQFAHFHIALHRPARPLSFGQLSCVRILVWSTVLCFRPCFQLGTPVSNLASGVRMIYSHLCSTRL